ncbi:MAG: TetR family transcriptional regulator [Kordiimonadaceae bacterium]|jgi:TetR/AcrR family transcriptional regulator, transcriptional repressor of bet genes|nr:TetR family transcriptional regulator [Kordiimonadaceae bacterium]MBT6033009.1 TetR family transcriptional regulator [Kordiimonadaceae bacterium]
MKKNNNIFDVNKQNSDKKQLFIDAAICSLGNHGYKGTTVRQIAKYAGVAPGLLTHYFKGKEVLIAESYKYLAKQFLDDFQTKIGEHETDPVKTLQLFFQNFFEPDNMGADYLRVWLAFWTLTLTEPHLRNTHKEIHNQYISSIENMLLDAFTANNIDITDKDPRSLAIGIHALLDGLWLECCLDPDAFSQSINLEIIYNFAQSTTGLNIKPT